MKRIWIVDDEPTICWALRKELESQGYAVEVFSSAESCWEHAKGASPYPHVVLLDVRLPGKSGLELLGSLQELPSQPAVIVMTAFGDLKVAVEAIKGKAFEYLTKPFNLGNALSMVRRALESHPAQPRNDPDFAAKLQQDTLLGNSPAMQVVYKQIAIAAQSEQPVMIEGDAGTGKSLVARTIHQFSPRASKPLVFFRPDANRVSESEVELFGTCLPSTATETGMGPKQPGLMLLSGQGTLVIEEVTQLSLAAQAKLLSAIETECFQAIASADPDPFKARLIFTSSHDLDNACVDGEIYEPLAAQLRVIHIRLPPLRERREDIRPLAEAFVRTSSPGARKQLSEEAMALLENWPWPGNVRQLRQTIQQASVHSRGVVIGLEDLPLRDPGSEALTAGNLTSQQLAEATRAWLMAHDVRYESDHATSTPSSEFLHDQFLAIAERALIQAMLEQCGGNRAAVASRLGMHRTTLRQKMKRYGL
jgi:DNA-binding NtrC family response regulator